MVKLKRIKETAKPKSPTITIFFLPTESLKNVWIFDADGNQLRCCGKDFTVAGRTIKFQND